MSAKSAACDRIESRWQVTAVLVLAVFICMPSGCWRSGRPQAVPDVPLPATFDQLEPAVAELVRQRIEKARAHPDQAEGHGDLGLVYEANGLWSEARQSLATAVALSPNDKGWRLHLAVATRELGDFDKALAMLKQLAADYPSYAPAQDHLGQAFLANGDIDRAAVAFERVVELAPDVPEGYVGCADVKLQRNELDQAIELLQKAIAMDSRYAIAHHLLGTAFQRQGRDSEAAAQFQLGQRAESRYLEDEFSGRLEEYAVNLRATIKQGVQAMLSRDFAKAAEKFEAALQADPDNVIVLNNLAGVHVQTGQTREAYDLLQQALQIDADKHTTHINLASWMLMSGRPTEALGYSETAVSLAPWVASTHRIRIQVLLSMKRVDHARLAVIEALQHVPQDAYIQQLAKKLKVSS